MKRVIIFTAVFVFSCCAISPQHLIAQNKKANVSYSYRDASPGGTGKFYMGREIARVVGPGSVAWLDRASRPQDENTQLAIDKIQVAEDAVIADVGAGSGYYTFKLAPKVPKGKVYAVEIQDEMIAAINDKKKEAG